jgi:hypothetical protein
MRLLFRSSNRSTIVDPSKWAFRNLQSIDARVGAKTKLFAVHRLNLNISFSTSGVRNEGDFDHSSKSREHSAALVAMAIVVE